MRATRFFPSTVVCFSIAFYSALVWSAEQLNYKDTVHIKEDGDDDDDDDDYARIRVFFLFVLCFYLRSFTYDPLVYN